MKNKKLRVLLLVAALSALVVGVLPGSASGATMAAAIEGEAHLPQFPGTGSGTFDGTGVGIHGTSACVLAPAHADFTYDDTAIVVGTADGTLSGCGHSTNFTWLRVGATAVLVFDGGEGAAVAAFAPLGAPTGGPIDAVVVGLGADAA